MEIIEAFQRIGLALAIGILVGIERGWQNRDLPAGGRVAGIRTFGLSGLLGGMAGYISVMGNTILPPALLICFAAAFLVFSFKEATERHDHSVTSVIAALVVYSLGFAAVTSSMEIAAAGGVATAGLLAARHSLHGFLKNLTWLELRSALVLLAMSFVALPLLPNRTIDPWNAFNPFQIWLLTILIAAISYVGYLAVRIAGASLGILFTGAAGGFVSSTAITLSFARLSKERPELSGRFSSAATIAGALSLGRAFGISSVLAPALLPKMAIVLLPAIAVFCLASIFLLRRSGDNNGHPELKLDNPFEFLTVLRFGALLGVVIFLSKVLVEFLGASSVIAVAFFSGLADLDAITLSMATLAGKSVPLQTAVFAILTAAVVNLIVKAILAWSFGTSAYARALSVATAATILAGGVGLLAIVNIPI